MGKPTTQATTAASSASTDLAIPWASLSFVKRLPGDGFLEALETMVLFAAQHADFDKYFQDQLACDPGDTDREAPL